MSIWAHAAEPRHRASVAPALLALGLLLAGMAAAQPGGADDCPGHWHAGFSVWVEDEKVAFPAQGDAADPSASPGAGAHVHGDDGILHFHPAGPRCIGLDGPLRKLGVDVAPASLTVHGERHHQNATHDLIVYHQPWGGQWGLVNDVEEFLDQQPGNGERIMVAYMDTGSEVGIAQRQEQTATLEGGAYEPPAGSGHGAPRPGGDGANVPGLPWAALLAGLLLAARRRG